MVLLRAAGASTAVCMACEAIIPALWYYKSRRKVFLAAALSERQIAWAATAPGAAIGFWIYDGGRYVDRVFCKERKSKMKKMVNTREHSTGNCISYIKHDEKRTNAANQKESRTNHAGHCINAQRSQEDCQIHHHGLKAYQIAPNNLG